MSDPSPATALPKITVLMPVFNGAEFLGEQVASILAQTGVDLRLVALDDGSSDNSYRILRRLAALNNRLVVFRNPKNLGLIRSLARLFEEVQGDYFSLADQDDIWDADKLARSIDALQRTGAVLVYSDVRMIDERGDVTASSYLHPKRLRPQIGRDPVPFVFRNPAIGHTIVGRSELVPEARGLPPDLVFHEAWIIGVACRIGEVTYLDSCLGSYRQHGRNVIGAKGALWSRLTGVFGKGGGFARRQRTRSRAIAALARLFPALVPIARLHQRRGLARLCGLPRFAVFLFPYAKRIGLVPVLTEIAFFPFAAADSADPQPGSKPASMSTQL